LIPYMAVTAPIGIHILQGFTFKLTNVPLIIVSILATARKLRAESTKFAE